VPKLREVDFVMRQNVALQDRVREFHPEVAWRRLASHALLSKHSIPGLLQRIGILNRTCPNWLDGTSEVELPKDIQFDDLLDATIGLSVAQAIVEGATPIRRFPEGDVPVDDCGLRMEIWY
jgi:predicted RNase H-like nuclease